MKRSTVKTFDKVTHNRKLAIFLTATYANRRMYNGRMHNQNCNQIEQATLDAIEEQTCIFIRLSENVCKAFIACCQCEEPISYAYYVGAVATLTTYANECSYARVSVENHNTTLHITFNVEHSTAQYNIWYEFTV